MSAEGCFFIGINKSLTTRTKVNIQLEFQLAQHIRDELLMKSLIKFLNCGYLTVNKSRNSCVYRVSNLFDITEKIIPLFKSYPVYGEKSKDFYDFCKVWEIIKLKKHLTKEGLDEIKKIKQGMNTGRSIGLTSY